MKLSSVVQKLVESKCSLSIEITGNPLRDEGAKAIADALKLSKHSHTLGLKRNEIGIEGAKAIADALISSSCAHVLSLDFNKILDEGAKAIADALKLSKHPHTLSLQENKIGVEGAKAIADSIKLARHSFVIAIKGNDIGVEGAKAIADALILAKYGFAVDIRENQIGVEGVKAIADALKLSKYSHTIDLGTNRIGNEGAKVIADALILAQCSHTVYLCFSNILNEGAKVIADTLKLSKHSHILNLGYNKVEEIEVIISMIKTAKFPSYIKGLKHDELAEAMKNNYGIQSIADPKNFQKEIKTRFGSDIPLLRKINKFTELPFVISIISEYLTEKELNHINLEYLQDIASSKFYRDASISDVTSVSGNGVNLCKQLPIASFYSKYYVNGLEQILDLRLEEEGISSITRLDCSILCNIKEFVKSDLVFVKKMLSESSNAIIKPYNIDYRHWVGIAFLPNKETLSIEYIDSENNPIPKILKDSISSVFPNSKVIEKVITPEIPNCCGAEVVEELVQSVSGIGRLSTKEAVMHHMILMQGNWLEEWQVGEIKNQYIDLTVENKVNRYSDDIVHIPQDKVYVKMEGLYERLKQFDKYLGNLLMKLWVIGRKSELAKLAENNDIEIKGLTIDQIYRKLALKLHPDKGNDEIAFKELQSIKSKEDGSSSLNKEILYYEIGNVLSKTNIGIKVVDIVLDGINIYQQPNVENVLKTVISGTQLYGMATDNLFLSLGVGAIEAVSKICNGEVIGAAIQAMTIPVGYSLGMAALATTFPATATVISIGLTGYSGYYVYNKGYEMLYQTEEILQIGAHEQQFEI